MVIAKAKLLFEDASIKDDIIFIMEYFRIIPNAIKKLEDPKLSIEIIDEIRDSAERKSGQKKDSKPYQTEILATTNYGALAKI